MTDAVDGRAAGPGAPPEPGAPGEPGWGVYGLRVSGLADAREWMEPLGPGEGLGSLRVDVTVGPGVAPARSTLDAEHAELRLVGGGALRMARGEGRARFWFTEPPRADELLHPWLAPAAAVTHLWAGREAFHGGAFLAPAGAVILLAAKEGGKSTTLAWLAGALRRPVLSDDLVIVSGGETWAGPRCLDLRAGAPAHGIDLEAARAVRRGDRLRVGLAPVPAHAPVAGIVELAWGETVGLGPVAAARRPPALLAHRMFAGRLAGDSRAVLELAALPMLSLTRPRGERGLRDATSALLDHFA